MDKRPQSSANEISLDFREYFHYSEKYVIFITVQYCMTVLLSYYQNGQISSICHLPRLVHFFPRVNKLLLPLWYLIFTEAPSPPFLFQNLFSFAFVYYFLKFHPPPLFSISVRACYFKSSSHFYLKLYYLLIVINIIMITWQCKLY